MKFKSVLFIVLLGLIVAGIGGGMVAYYDNQANLLSQKIEANYRDDTGIAEIPLAMADRDHFADAEGKSIVLMVLGLLIAGIAPLGYVAGKWRAGELSIPLKQASVAMSVGLLLLTVGIITLVSASVRLSQIEREIIIINGRGEISMQDTDNWVILFSLYTEKDMLSSRLPYFGTAVCIGLLLAVLSGVAARRETVKREMAKPPRSA